MPKSTLTNKYQTTVPKVIRQRLGLSPSDTLQWEYRDGRVVVSVARTGFLKHRGILEEGPTPAEAVRETRRRRGTA